MNKQEAELTEFVDPKQLLQIVKGIIEKGKIISMIRTTSLSGRDTSGMYLIVYEPK